MDPAVEVLTNGPVQSLSMNNDLTLSVVLASAVQFYVFRTDGAALICHSPSFELPVQGMVLINADSAESTSFF